MTDTDYSAVMRDVRYAYRIVAAYQQQILYIMKTFQSFFQKRGNFKWKPAYTDRPPQSSTFPWDGSRWAWDGLPYYNMQCDFFLTGGDRQERCVVPGKYCIFALLQTDTAFPSSDTKEPDPLAVVEGDSTLTVGVYQVAADAEGGLNLEALFKNDSQNFSGSAGEWHDLQNKGVRRLMVKYRIADLLPENAAEKEFKELYERLLKTGLYKPV